MIKRIKDLIQYTILQAPFRASIDCSALSITHFFETSSDFKSRLMYYSQFIYLQNFDWKYELLIKYLSPTLHIMPCFIHQVLLPLTFGIELKETKQKKNGLLIRKTRASTTTLLVSNFNFLICKEFQLHQQLCSSCTSLFCF